MNTCKGSRAQQRQIDISRLPVGQQVVIISQGVCGCCSGCRRVALWHPRPLVSIDVEGASNWIVKTIARVRFGDGCNGGPEVEVDWKTGVILDLMGCSVEVALEIVEKTGSIPDEDNLFTYGALVACCGAGGARGCATRTTAQVTTGVGAVSVIPIPPFAYAVMIAPAPDNDFFLVDVTVSQSGSSFAAGAILMLTTADLFPGEGWTLIGGAESIVVGNNSAEELDYEVVFLIGV